MEKTEIRKEIKNLIRMNKDWETLIKILKRGDSTIAMFTAENLDMECDVKNLKNVSLEEIFNALEAEELGYDISIGPQKSDGQMVILIFG